MRVREAVDEARIRQRLLSEFNIEIGAGLGSLKGKIWRIGLMGENSTPQNVDTILNALDTLLACSQSKRPAHSPQPETALQP